MKPTWHSRLMATIAALASGLILQAQGEVQLRSATYSDGVHPCFTVSFDDTEKRAVEDHWRKVLKGVSHRVGGRRELIGEAALLPAISPDTMRILVKTETSKALPRVTVHVAFHTTQGYAGRDGDERMTEACLSFVKERSIAFSKENALARLNDAEKRLQRLRHELDLLVREHERAVGQHQKALQRAATAAEDQVRLAKEASDLKAEHGQMQARIGADPSEEDVRDLKDLARRLGKAESGVKSAADHQRSSEKRAADITRALERNVQDQEKLRDKITAQEGEVKRRTEAYEAIH